MTLSLCEDPRPAGRLAVFVDAPAAFTPRAAWVLDTMLAPLGWSAALTNDPDAAEDACLAYAAAPVPGVPTLPRSAQAMELIGAQEPIPPGTFAACPAAGGVVGAFPVEPEAGFAVCFDLIASAFVLLACWDERTSKDRDRYGRLPYSASVFAANPALSLEEPAVDAYVELLRAMLAPRLAELGIRPSRPAGWVWRDASVPVTSTGCTQSAPHAVALTHDLDHLWCWTLRGFAAAGYHSACALCRGDFRALSREIGGLAEWLTHHLPRRSDPFWTFPQMLGGEDARSVRSTFFVIARHTHERDGNQPRTYRRRIPAALALLRRHGREIGLHGNDADRLGVEALAQDRESLAAASGNDIRGMRYHFLRCLYHETLPFLERAGFSYDTSLAFAEREGYRCGCSFPFRPYFLEEERPLDLVELPLAVMDGTLQGSHYRGLTAAEAERAAAGVLDRAARGGGAVSILWHNNRFDRRLARGYDDVYWRLVDHTLAGGGWVTSAGDIVARWRQATGMSVTDPQQAAGPPELRSVKDDLTQRPRLRRMGQRRPHVVHLSVVHKPDDPRIHDRECRSLVTAGYEVMYVAPGAGRGLDEHGVLLSPLPRRGRSTRFLDTFEIAQMLRAVRPDVVHVHDPELLTLFPALRPLVPRLVYDMHEYVPEAVAGKHYIPARIRPHAARATAVAQRKLAALADGVVVVTEEQFSALGEKPELRVVLPNYPRLGRFDVGGPVADLGADPRLKLIYVGSLSSARGCLMMLDVMEQLSCDEAVLYLGGVFTDPICEAEVRARLAGGLDDRVRLLGRVPPLELPRYLAAADVVWVPSLPNRQYGRPTIPTKLLEGMAMRLAALVSDMPGRGELVRREECGLAVPPGPDGHLNGVRQLLDDRQAIFSMGERGRRAVERCYSWEAVAGDLVSFYDSLCAGLPGQSRTRRAPEE